MLAELLQKLIMTFSFTYSNIYYRLDSNTWQCQILLGVSNLFVFLGPSKQSKTKSHVFSLSLSGAKVNVYSKGV